MNRSPQRTPPYRPIEDYGIIGNLASVALVRLDGSIDWCCLPGLQSPSIFAALLGAENGGFFLVQPTQYSESKQYYVEATNVLKTIFRDGQNQLEVCDFMPTAESLDVGDDSADPLKIYRRLHCTHGEMDIRVVWAPRHDYGQAQTTIEKISRGFVASGGTHPFGFAGLPEGQIVDTDQGPVVCATISLRQGQKRFLLNRWDENSPEVNPEKAEQELRRTIDAWVNWATHPETGLERPWAGAWESEILRSELFLKLMTRRNSGALAAAPTTSLPETLGGVRNWDYRFSWIRDAAQIAQAFFAVGHKKEAAAFIHWAEEVACADRHGGEGLQILYPLEPDAEVDERHLDHLEGYRQSRPVRVGNGAVDQLQLDVYGELLNAVYEQARLSDYFDAEMGQFLSHVVDEACKAWHHPDYSIWELHSGPRHLVYSKFMCWVALDRAIWLHEKGHLQGDIDSWKNTRREIHQQVLEYGYNNTIEAFTQRFHGHDLDASNLLIPMSEFLPPDDPRVQSTIDRTLEELTVNDLVFRYKNYDGIAGDEGAFPLCTCWLIDALAISDRLDEAHRIFDGLLRRTNHLGLLSEQIDPYSGEFLGNFPQAYSHLGIINSALYLAEREGKEIPIGSLLGAR